MSNARSLLIRHWLWAAVVVAFVLRVAYVLAFARTRVLGWDAEVYRDLGRQLSTSGSYNLRCNWVDPCAGRPTLLFPPLFPLLSGALARVGLGSVLASQVAMAALGSATVGVVGLLGRQVGRLTGRAGVGPIAAALAAVNPLWIALGGALMSETLMVFLVSVTLLASMWALAGTAVTRWIAPGMLLGLGVLTHGEGILLLVTAVVPAALAWTRPWTGRLAAVAVTILATTVLVSPWAARNTSVFGRVTVAQPGWAGSWSDIDDPAFPSGAYPSEPTVTVDGREQRFAELTGTEELAYYDALQSQAIAQLRSDPQVIAPVAVKRVARMFGLIDPFQFQTGPIVIRRLITPFGWLLTGFGIVGLWLLRRRVEVAVLFAGTLVTVIVASVIVYGNPRFRVGAEPALSVCAAVAASALASWLAQKYQGNDDQSGSRFSKKASRPSAASSVM